MKSAKGKIKSLLALIQGIVSPLIFSNLARQYKGRTSLLKIKAAQLYVEGVNKVRILLLGGVLVLCSLILFGSGLFLIHTALLTYSTWNAQVKFTVALLLGVAEFLGGAAFVFYLFREETWGKVMEINKVVNLAVQADTENEGSAT